MEEQNCVRFIMRKCPGFYRRDLFCGGFDRFLLLYG